MLKLIEKDFTTYNPVETWYCESTSELADIPESAPDVAVSLYVEISVEEFPQWVQPTGAQDAYKNGDKVTYDNKHWISTADNNVWQPGVYGWEEINE